MSVFYLSLVSSNAVVFYHSIIHGLGFFILLNNLLLLLRSLPLSIHCLISGTIGGKKLLQ